MIDKIKSFLPLNFGLMSNPYNWVVIVLMVVLAGLMAQVILSNGDNTE